LFQNKFAGTSVLSEVEPPFVVVVAPAPQLDLVEGRLATQSVRIDVVELQEPALVAPMAAGSDEGATPEVPQPDRTLDLG